jgi:hypothetical protein
MSRQANAHEISSAVQWRPCHRLNGSWPYYTLQPQLFHYIIGKINFFKRIYRFGQIESAKFDLMQIEEFVNFILLHELEIKSNLNCILIAKKLYPASLLYAFVLFVKLFSQIIICCNHFVWNISNLCCFTNF